MFVFAREPIFDDEQQLFAYQLVFRDGVEGKLPLTDQDNSDIGYSDDAASQIKVGLNEILDGFVSVLSVSRSALFSDALDELTPEDTILELNSIDGDDDELIEKLLVLRQSGFRISVQHHSRLNDSGLKLAHYLKIDINRISLSELSELKQEISSFHVKIIATRVETPEQYDKCVTAGFDYFQGYFFLARPHKHHDELPANKLSLLNLLAQTADNDIDMNKIRHTFEQDATLSYLLMRFINNPMINKSHKITSIKHALTYLGEVMLRKFVAIISIAQLNQDNVQELLQVSLVRAKYCELIDVRLGKKKDSMSGFMVGLFSLIDVILDRDLSVLLSQIPLSQEINDALIQRKGSFHIILASVRSLESSSWLPFKDYAKEIGLDESELHDTYLQAVRWNNEITQGQSNMFPVARA